MLQVQRNLTNGSVRENKIFVNLLRTESSIVDHMELSIYKSTCDNRTLKKTVLIFIGYEYTVSFYDIESCNIVTLTGVVESFTGDNSNYANQYFTLRYVPQNQSASDVDKEVTKGLPNCSCVFNKPSDDKYPVSTTVDICTSMIMDINYATKGIPCPGLNEEGVKVVLLGISAEIVKAIVINLKMINDGCCCSNPVKDVTLEVGNKYTISYFNSKDNAVYTFDGKLISITETDNSSTSNSIVRVCEQAGLNNSIYNSNCCIASSDKDKFLCGNNIQNDILPEDSG